MALVVPRVDHLDRYEETLAATAENYAARMVT